jgi:secreted trypsin-like serine protease
MQLLNGLWHLVGIVSNGVTSCNGVGVYTNVSFYYEWILENSIQAYSSN